jgi:hypothetical protein
MGESPNIWRNSIKTHPNRQRSDQLSGVKTILKYETILENEHAPLQGFPVLYHFKVSLMEGKGSRRNKRGDTCTVHHEVNENSRKKLFNNCIPYVRNIKVFSKQFISGHAVA